MKKLLIVGTETSRKLIKELTGNTVSIYEADSMKTVKHEILESNITHIITGFLLRSLSWDGLSLAEAIKKDYPEIKIALVTGMPHHNINYYIAKKTIDGYHHKDVTNTSEIQKFIKEFLAK